MSHVTLKGSFRFAPKGRRQGKEIGKNTKLRASLQTPTILDDAEIQALLAEIHSGKRPHLTPEELPAVLGSRSEHVRAINQAAKKAGLKVEARSLAHRAHGIVPVSGTYAAFQKFSPGLKLFKFHKKGKGKGKEYVIDHEGALTIQEGLPIVGFFGLRQREIAHTNYRVHRPGNGKQPRKIPNGLTSRGLALLQGWNAADLDAQVRVTAYISLGGDNQKISTKDLVQAAKHDGIKSATFKRESVGGASNGSYSDDSTVENKLDLLAQALLNPNGGVVCFQADNTDDAFCSAGEAINVYKGLKIGGRLVKISVASISWGTGESNTASASRQRWARVGLASQLVGIDFLSATGDNGPKDNTDDYTGDDPSTVPWIGGAAGVGIESSNGRTVSAIFPWDDTAGGGGMTGYGISVEFAPMKEEARLNLPVGAVTQKPGHSASVFADLAQPASCANIPDGSGGWEQVGGTSHSAPFQAAKASAVKTKHGIPSILAQGYAQGEKMVDKLTQGNSSAPYPADPSALYNVMTGFGVLSPKLL
jgi:hypothetical protein